MFSVLVVCCGLFADPVPTKDGETPRKPHPLAPSLPLLTDEEEKKLDLLIDRFIQADTGKMTGPSARDAIDDFKSLGPEATFALIRGMNKAAHINHSCPALTIGRKLSSILRTSNDKDLIQYAKENIGAGVKQSRHMDTIKDLKLGCVMRLSAIKNAKTPEIKGAPKP